MNPTIQHESVGVSRSKLPNPEDQPTMSVPEAGKMYFGLARNASYEAARRGDIPTIRVGGRIMALVRPLERKLEGEPLQHAAA